MTLFTFSILEWKHPFWANLVQKIKIVSLSWNLVPTLIRISRIQWWCSFFSILDRKHPFWANLVQKVKIVSLSWNLVARLIRICRIQWRCSLFLFYSGNTHFSYESKLKAIIVPATLRDRDFEIGRCRQHGIFMLLQWVYTWIVFIYCLKSF